MGEPNSLRLCIGIIGAPAAGKTTAARAMCEMREDVRVCLVGANVRASPGDHADVVAERAIERACERLPPNQLLLLDGIKNSRHLHACLTVLRRHGLRLVGCISLERGQDSARDLCRGRADDKSLKERQARWQINEAALNRELEQRGIQVVAVQNDCVPQPEERDAEVVLSVDWPSTISSDSKYTACVLPSRSMRTRLVEALECGVRSLLPGWTGPSDTATDTIGIGLKALSLDDPAQKLADVLQQLYGEHSLPARNVVDESSLHWLASSGRYDVSLKCDGVRMFLLQRSGELFLIDRRRKAVVWTPLRSGVDIGDDTLLDGEFMQLDSDECFYAFDVLKLRGEPVWQLARDARVQALSDLSLVVEPAVLVRPSAAAATASAPSIVLKHAEPLSPDSLHRSLVALSGGGAAFPTDGLIFSARQLPYQFGADDYTLKWQPTSHVFADLAISECSICIGMNSRSRTPLLQLRVQHDVCKGMTWLYMVMPSLMPLLQSSFPVTKSVALALSLIGGGTPSDDDAALLGRLDLRTQKNLGTMVDELKVRIDRDVSDVARIVGTSSVELAKLLACLLKSSYHSAAPNVIVACKWVGLSTSDARGSLLHWDTTHQKVYRLLSKKGDGGWFPVAVRTDKLTSNAAETVASMQAAATRKGLRDAAELEAAFVPILSRAQAVAADQLIQGCPQQHPAFQIPFAELEAGVAQAELAGHVQRVQVVDGLSILSYTSSAPPADRIASMCRGLVLSSERVVAAPFFRFHRHHDKGSELNARHPVQATVKYDGSLIVAFCWKSELMTCTRRRADSEQAIWAKQWLSRNAKAALKAGNTYMFEAVYQVNTVVVKYAREACILLVSMAK